MNKVSSNRQKKEKIVAELSEKVAKAKAMVFANYEGMTHQQLESLKKALRKTDAEMIVAKNTLLKRSLSTLDSPASPASTRGVQRGEQLSTFNSEGPTAALFAYSDIVSPLKELARVIKNLKLPYIKFGILNQKMLTAEEVIKLASLPSREVLLAQFVGGLKSPIFGLHRALNWNIQKLVLTLGAIQVKKS